jgi:hypothetical protein
MGEDAVAMVGDTVETDDDVAATAPAEEHV